MTGLTDAGHKRVLRARQGCEGGDCGRLGVDCGPCHAGTKLDKAGVNWREPAKLEWREDYLATDRPSDDAPREIWCMQGGLPVHRFVIEHIPGSGEFTLGGMECAFFGGRGCETAYFLWALDGRKVSNRYGRAALRLANDLQAIVDNLRRVAEETKAKT